MIKAFLVKEYSYYKKLSLQARSLLFSSILYSLAEPIWGFFTQAFIWRERSDFLPIALYNLANCVGLAVGFYLNGVALRKVKITNLFAIGFVMHLAVIGLLVVFNLTSDFFIGISGFLFGVGLGMVWANRNYLTLAATKQDERTYYTSLENSSDRIIGILMPFLAGSIIASATTTKLYSITTAYILLVGVLVIIIIAVIIMMRRWHFENPHVVSVRLQNVSKRWREMRFIQYLLGLADGVNAFLPSLLVLMLIGEEGELGTIKSLCALATAIVLYIIGRKTTRKQRIYVMGLGVTGSIIGGLIVGSSFSALGVLLYILILTIGTPLIYTATSPLMLDAIEADGGLDPKKNYSYIFDAEVWLNVGRITAIILFAIFIRSASANQLRWVPFVLACAQVVLWVTAFRFLKKGTITAHGAGSSRAEQIA